ncbi:hypothetical protein MUK42_16599 [Musa troglodytarum]|uniref:Uncharacterized protein n=1 Tax=Musa troglodytarum TaxID=320322 RepID=A0A9E7G0A5_9LILI|nr:hypothetical protein MUK42_16599 [Musa troglodytarum]URE04303.1 hypothetical protein MUK42_16599 [Musa troglodytarum]URE04304.1 hypothetical protein MUK42_16599 [Musa troglodytarum]
MDTAVEKYEDVQAWKTQFYRSYKDCVHARIKSSKLCSEITKFRALLLEWTETMVTGPVCIFTSDLGKMEDRWWVQYGTWLIGTHFGLLCLRVVVVVVVAEDFN